MSNNTMSNILSFLLGMVVMGLVMLSTIHYRDTAIIKMYTEGKIECATVGGEFICVERKE